MSYKFEYTDTFAGETNYSWVDRGEVDSKDLIGALREARKELGMTGVKGDIQLNSGDFVSWKPRGCCTLLMVFWNDSSEEDLKQTMAQMEVKETEL